MTRPATVQPAAVPTRVLGPLLGPILGLALGLWLPWGAALAAEEARQPGWHYMSAALQALQRDATLHPGQLTLAEGEALWWQPAPNGRACAHCHAQPPEVAHRYPAFDAASGRPVTLAGRIDACRQTHQAQAAEGPDGAAVMPLAAWLGERSKGRPVVPDARLAHWSSKGRELWRQRMGQLNLACTHCHDERAGQRLGGAAIPQAHPTGYPTYRLEWQGMGSLQRRMRGCLAGVRAEPFAPAADEWLALEAWLMQRAAGMAWEGVAVRP